MPLLALISQRSLTLAAKFGRKPVLADKARENALLIMMDVIIGLVGNHQLWLPVTAFLKSTFVSC